MIKPEDIKLCKSCCRGNLEDIQFRMTPGNIPEENGYKGCWECGGYGYISQKCFCSKCDKEYWMRPGPFTAYEGKEMRTQDSQTVFYSSIGLVCKNCYEELCQK